MKIDDDYMEHYAESDENNHDKDDCKYLEYSKFAFNWFLFLILFVVVLFLLALVK